MQREQNLLETLEGLKEQNRVLKTDGLKMKVAGYKGLKNQVKNLETEYMSELQDLKMLLEEKGKQINAQAAELKRNKLKLADFEKKMRLREDEISILEEKILGLQKTIR